MDPEENSPPPSPSGNMGGSMGGHNMGGSMGGVAPPPQLGGSMGGIRPSLPSRSVRSGPSVHSRGAGTSSSRSNPAGDLPPGEILTQVSTAVLRISPASGSATFGYTYLDDNERHHEDALTV
jgi:hypothetical protein